MKAPVALPATSLTEIPTHITLPPPLVQAITFRRRHVITLPSRPLPNPTQTPIILLVMLRPIQPRHQPRNRLLLCRLLLWPAVQVTVVVKVRMGIVNAVGIG